jgi:cytochrome c oxidase subunit 3
MVEKTHREKVAKPLLWIGMVSIVMMFAGLTSGYIVRRGEGNWLQFELPDSIYASTVLIVLSSLSMIWATSAARKNDFKGITSALIATLVLALGFVFFQVWSWEQLVEMGVYFTGPGSNAAGSFLYVITLAHLLHIVGGLIVLIVMIVQSVKRKYTIQNRLGLQLGSIFWHFLGGLWVYLFLFLVFIR